MGVFIAVLALLILVVPPISQVLLGHAVSILPYDPVIGDCPPALYNAAGNCAYPPSGTHVLGTDNLNRDMFSRVLAALPLDLFIGFSVTGFALLVGGGLGLVAGFWDTPRTLGGFVSAVIMRVTDIFLAFPSLVLALAIAASLGRGTGPSILAILFTWWPYYVRLVRGEVLAVKHQPYVVAARAAGVSNLRILFRHVLRNVIEPVVVYYTLDVGTVIVTFSTISFIGIGVTDSILRIQNLSIDYVVGAGTFHAVRNVSLDMSPGRVLGIVGETGCGKSTLAHAIPRLLPEPPAKIVSGSIVLQGIDLLQVPKWKLPMVRGTGIGMIFQEPINSLNPSYRIYDQLAEAVRIRRLRELGLTRRGSIDLEPFDYARSKTPKTLDVLTHAVVPTTRRGGKWRRARVDDEEIRAAVLEYLKLVRINDPETILQLYPHELDRKST